MPREITLKVNGQSHHVIVEPETPLIYVLRNYLGLKGTKIGCGLEQCGACKVIIDGQAVPSCRMPVRNVQGLSITTIEGLGTVEEPHPLQQAFVEERAMQCGYCTSGMIITAKALLDRRRYPSDEEIRAEFTEDLCRCGVYDRVLRAIKRTIGRPIMSAVFEVKAEDAVESTSGSRATIQALPGPLAHTPELDSWLRFNTDGSVTVFTGKVEIGQGIRTAVAQIAAEELDLSFERVQVAAADTDRSPDEGFTSGSMSLETTGEAIRLVAAEARHQMLLGFVKILLPALVK